MADFVIRYWLEVIFGLVIAGLSCGYKNLAQRAKEQEAIKLGIQALLRDRLIESYNNYADRGYCPIYARENLEALFKQYKALGGNGVVATLVGRLEDFPTEGDE